VGVGCNNFGRRVNEAGTAAVIDAAIDAGINFFDTANMYGEGLSEEYMGRALRGRRDRVVIATKVGLPMKGEAGGGAPAYVRAAADRSLHRLGIDCIDLYQFHEPDPKVPIADTLGAFQDLVRAGKVREIGCSNFTASMLREADDAAAGGPRFVSVQNHYSMLHREPETGVLQECERLGIAFLPFYPLESGLLTGKVRRGSAPPADSRLSEERYKRFLTESNLDTVEQLIAYAESQRHTVIELAFGWLLAHEVIASVIAGARRPEQARMNAKLDGWILTDRQLRDVTDILGGSA
jgi:aryl-alcohol dehydrogenase-like predicted oxidoreductase